MRRNDGEPHGQAFGGVDSSSWSRSQVTGDVGTVMTECERGLRAASSHTALKSRCSGGAGGGAGGASMPWLAMPLSGVDIISAAAARNTQNAESPKFAQRRWSCASDAASMVELPGERACRHA